MGLFDYVSVEVPIEGIPDPSAVEWQTKEFECPYMDHYKITGDGRLLLQLVRYEDRSDPSAPPGSLESLRGMMTPVAEGWWDTNFHGDLHFRAHIHGVLTEVVARFTDGQLVRAAVLPAEAPGDG